MVSNSEIIKILSLIPSMLHRSLENHFVGRCNFLKQLIYSDDKTLAVIKRCYFSPDNGLNKGVRSKIKFMCHNGVPELNVVSLLYHYPRAFIMNFNKFKNVV